MRLASTEHQQGMIAAYQAGASAKRAAALYGYSMPTCLAALRRSGLQPRPIHTYRKYHCNEGFFDCLNSETKVYWLGFLTADAHIARTRIQLGLAAKDRGHLEALREALSSTQPISDFVTSSGHAVSRLSLGSLRMASRLRELGLEHDKSYTATPCVAVPSELEPHYWRGLVDGDGWVTRNRRGKWSIGLSGTRAVVYGFVQFLRTSGVRSNARPFQTRNVWIVLFSGTGIAKQIAAVLWGRACVGLERKATLACDLLATPIRKHRSVQLKP